MSNLDIAKDYADKVLTNKIVACELIKLSCKKFLDDLQNPLFYYDSSEVDLIVKFIQQFNLLEQTKPKKFKLENWQIFIIVNVYGLFKKEDNTRKHQQIYFEIARKNGKSELVTILAIYHLLFDVNSQIIVSANSREQVKNTDFKKIKQFAEQIDPNKKEIIHYYNKLIFNTNELIVTASEAGKLDGLNISTILLDEFHEAPNNELYNVLKSAQGSRDNPLFYVITTAGFNINSFCYQLRNYAVDVLKGNVNDDSLFSVIYTLDEEDDFTDEKVWVKSNPNLNISLKKSWLKGEVNRALQNNAEKLGVLVKNFNVWAKSKTIDEWIEDKYIIQSMQNINVFDNEFSDYEVCVGIDLASVSDIAAVSIMMNYNNKYYFFNRLYLCEDAVNKSVNRLLYKQAIDNGELVITSGNVIDYDYILKDLLELSEKHFIRTIFYDPYNSTQFVISATNAGLFLKPYNQTNQNLNKPIKELERLIKSNKIVIQKSDMVKWMLNNVSIKVKDNGNYTLDKSNRDKKIDVASSMVTALGGYLQNPNSFIII